MLPQLRTTQNLLDQGYSYQRITQEHKNQTLTRIRRGIYLETSTWKKLYPSDKHLLNAHALARQGDYVFTHSTAALILGLPVLKVPHQLQIYAETASRSKVQGAQKHYYRQAPEIIHKGRLRVTSPEQTIIDCAKTLPLPDALCIADSALYRGVTSLPVMQGALRRAGGRGVRQCRRIADLTSHLAESPGETLTRLELINAGIAFTEQPWISTPTGRYRADFTIDGYPILLEFDGNIKYRDDEAGAVLAERKRERALQNLGWTVIRVEWQHLKQPGLVGQLVRQAMERVR